MPGSDSGHVREQNSLFSIVHLLFTSLGSIFLLVIVKLAYDWLERREGIQGRMVAKTETEQSLCPTLLNTILNDDVIRD